jgi:hypothetical protein
LTSQADLTNMKTVKAVVKSRMKELGWKPYDLAKAVDTRMAKQTVYNFLLRKAELNTKNLGPVLDALGLEIRPKAKR